MCAYAITSVLLPLIQHNLEIVRKAISVNWNRSYILYIKTLLNIYNTNVSSTNKQAFWSI